MSNLASRYRAEWRFRLYGILAVLFAVGCLVTLFVSILSTGFSAFRQSYIRLGVTLEKEMVAEGNYGGLLKTALDARFPEATSRQEKKKLYGLISQGGAFDLRKLVEKSPDLVGQKIELWVPASADVDMLMKGHISRSSPESERRVSDREIAWLDSLIADKSLELRFNTRFFTAGDSREPELAGILGAFVGSLLTMLVTIALAFPLGVAAAIYLEEFAPRNRITDFIEVNINNLAAVPSIVFGLLGLAVFLSFFGMPRSAPVAGGVVLALMTLPTIIIAGRAALASVPPSIREAAYGMGASPLQVVFHHTLPLALPGMLTGAIIGMARALGESAPLLMIGMVAFIVDIPGSFTDPATVLPVQIYLWADSPERAFVERTSAAIIVLLVFLVSMNALAVILRKKFERRW
jgi:phosphate transport system permease protein